MPSFLAANTESKGYKLTVLGDNIFAAVYNFLNSTDSKAKSSKNVSLFISRVDLD